MAREEIVDLIHNINDAWTSGDANRMWRELGAAFHDAMVIRGPDLTVYGRGKRACIESYVDFTQKAIVRECRLGEVDAEVWGDTAVASFTWEMAYEMKGQSSTEKGKDVFVFTRQDGRWFAVCRIVSTN